MPTMLRLMSAASGMDMTFHRAIDMAKDPVECVDELAKIGIPRILTSGGIIGRKRKVRYIWIV